MIRILPLKLDRQMFCLYEDTKLLAKCYYSDESGEIFGLDVLDEEAAKPWYTAMLKATMSSMEYAGVTLARCKNKDLYPLLKNLRFQHSPDGAMEVSLVGYFDHACECSSCASCDRKDACDQCIKK